MGAVRSEFATGLWDSVEVLTTRINRPCYTYEHKAHPLPACRSRE